MAPTPDTDVRAKTSHAEQQELQGDLAGAAATYLDAIELAAVNDDDALGIRARRANLLGVLAPADDAIAAWQDIAGRANAAADQVAVSRALMQLAHLTTGEERTTYLRTLAAMPRELGWPVLAAGRLEMAAGDVDAALDTLEEARVIALASGDRHLEATAHGMRSALLPFTGRLDESIEAGRIAIHRARATGLFRWVLLASLNVIEALVQSLRADEAIATCEELLEYIDTNGLERWRTVVSTHYAVLLADVGRIREATAVSTRTFDAAAGRPGDREESLVPLLHALVLLDAGTDALDQLLPLVASARERLGQSDVDASFAAELTLLDTAIAARAGRVDEMLAAVRSLTIDEPVLVSRCALLLARAGTSLGESSLLDRARELCAQLEDDVPLSAVQRAEVDAHVAGDVSALEDVAARWGDAGRAPDVLRCEVAIAELARRARDRTRAAASLARAAIGFHRLGFHADAADARLRLTNLDPTCVPTFAASRGQLELGDALAARVSCASRCVLLPAGGELDAADVDARQLMLVHAGSIRQFREQSGKELTTSLLGAGGVLGEEALLPDEDHDTSLVRAVAVEPSIVELVPAQSCRELADRFPDLERALLRIAMRRAGDAERLAEAIAYLPLEERLAQLLLDLAARYGRATLDGGLLIDTSVTQQQLASMVGAGREALARLFTNWRGAGTIELRRRQVVLLDQPALRALAGE